MKQPSSILLLVLIISCKSSKLPLESFTQYEYDKSYTFENGELTIELKNPLNCPLRVWIFNSHTELQVKFDEINPVELKIKSDTILVFSDITEFDTDINFSSRLGSLSKTIEPIKVELPFPRNKEYRIIQGNNTNITHNTDWSRYAIDFNLKINDTVCSATGGFVVGVVNQYKFGGVGDKWKPFGNYITIYEPYSGIFTQYVHLVQDGSFVQVGDQILSGQPIGLSGKTGQTNIEHLHFNCLIPTNNNDGLKSIPIEFIEGYESEKLIKNDIVKK